MFSEVDGPTGKHRVVNMLPPIIEELEIWEAALYFTPSGTDPTDAAVRSYRARSRGERIEPRPVSVDGPLRDLILASRSSKNEN